jgi:hypothetical protein
MSNLYKGPSIDASYQVSVHLAGSEEKIKMWKVNRRWTPSDGKSSLCLWQGELKNWMLFSFSPLLLWNSKSYNKSVGILQTGMLSPFDPISNPDQKTNEQ